LDIHVERGAELSTDHDTCLSATCIWKSLEDLRKRAGPEDFKCETLVDIPHYEKSKMQSWENLGHKLDSN